MPLQASGGVESAVDSVVALAGESTLLVVAVALGAVALVLGLAWLFNYLRRSRAHRLRKVLAAYDDLAVLMHPNPDPDAMSSAMAVGELADSVDTDATLYYPGQIRHQENRAFQTVLDLDFDRVGAANEIDADGIVLVDHNRPRGIAGAESIEPVAVIDHHPGDGSGEAFTDVRTDYGSCASIFAEYFESLGWDPVDPDEVVSEETDEILADGSDADVDVDVGGEGELPPTLATGLLYGIQSDTKQLTKGCNVADFRAAEYLYAGVDQDVLDRIANPQVDAEVLDIKAQAITSRDVRNAFAVSDVGRVNNVDAVPQAADELMRLEGITAVVVVGEKDGNLHLSGRSRDDRVHMGQALEAVVEDIPMGNAGGHARMGGGQLSIEHMEGIGPSEGVDREEFANRLFDAMSGDI